MVSHSVISVVIATFNRCAVLKTTLDKLKQQSLPPENFEVIVMDDGSRDNTSAMIGSLASSMPYALRYYRHENRGPGYTQNRGIREAKSDIVLLIADDIWATPSLLESHMTSHKEHPGENTAVLGRVMQSQELPQTTIQKHWDPFGFDRFRGKEFIDSIYFYACNISFKKSFMLEHGLFKERTGASHEDVELGYRLWQKGLRILYNESALAYHYHEETLSTACKRAYERGFKFDLLSENLPKYYIFPAYKIFSREAGLSAMLRMLPHEILRQCLFNTLFVNAFWLPILRHAESSRLASLFANNITYRGTIFHHIRKGFKDAKRKRKSVKE
jgi:GT2 family glycosyltransferase